MATEVVVLGGGYVGVWAARKALQGARPGMVAVTLVSMSPAHAFHGWTAEVITGHVRPQRARVALTRLLPGVRIVHGIVAGVDLDERLVQIVTDDGSRALPYDELVIGVGSRDAIEHIPGLSEHGWSLKTDTGLGELNDHLVDVIAQAAATADAVERRRLLTVIVAGGGFTGTEASAAIAQRLRTAIAAEPALAGTTPHVLLLSSAAKLLPGLRPRFDRVADYATTQAEEAGVEIRFGMRLDAVTAGGASLADGSFVPSATVISTIGQTPVAVPGTERLERDESGRLVTDRQLRVAPGVWAGGDVAAVPHPSGIGACPANALWAIYHGKRAGANIARAVSGRTPKPFRFPGLGQGASVGVGRGAAELYGISLTGWVAWIARWGFFHAYMPSRRVALATAAEWFRAPVLPGARRAASAPRRAVPQDRGVLRTA